MSHPHVFVSRNIPEAGLSLLRGTTVLSRWEGAIPPTPKELIRALASAEGYLSVSRDPINAEVIRSTKKLRVISQFGVGYDNINVPAATRRGIAVCNTPEVLTETVADLTLGLLICAVRGIARGDRFVRTGRWKEMRLTQDVHGRTLGLVGLGRIGQAVARRARAFSLEILYYDPVRDRKVEKELGVRFVSLEKLLAESDFVSLHVPLSKATYHLISGRELTLMKDDAILINTARGAVVDQPALVRALAKKKIGGAALDVYEEEPLPEDAPLTRLENVVLAPHVGSATVETRNSMAVLAAENLLAVLAGRKPRFILNPEVLKKPAVKAQARAKGKRTTGANRPARP